MLFFLAVFDRLFRYFLYLADCELSNNLVRTLDYGYIASVLFYADLSLFIREIIL